MVWVSKSMQYSSWFADLQSNGFFIGWDGYISLFYYTAKNVGCQPKQGKQKAHFAKNKVCFWSWQSESNWWPRHYQWRALPTEPCQHRHATCKLYHKKIRLSRGFSKKIKKFFAFFQRRCFLVLTSREKCGILFNVETQWKRGVGLFSLTERGRLVRALEDGRLKSLLSGAGDGELFSQVVCNGSTVIG